MRFNRKGKSTNLMWILCTICTLLLGICFHNVETDSYLAYQDLTFGSIDSSAEYVAASVLCSTQKGVPVQQFYISENSCQGSSALVPRKTTQRTLSRSACGASSNVLLMGICSSAFFFGQEALSFGGLCEVISNTVILHYIHRQDGEKA